MVSFNARFEIFKAFLHFFFCALWVNIGQYNFTYNYYTWFFILLLPNTYEKLYNGVYNVNVCVVFSDEVCRFKCNRLFWYGLNCFIIIRLPKLQLLSLNAFQNNDVSSYLPGKFMFWLFNIFDSFILIILFCLVNKE